VSDSVVVDCPLTRVTLASAHPALLRNSLFTVRSPNLLFVFSDQHRWCDLRCYGNADVATPHFDRFATQGVRVERCLSNSPLCVPSRGSLLTGLFPLRHGAVSNDLPIRHDVTSVADVLGSAGYRTGYIGKWHLAGVPRDQVIPAGRGRLGFQEWKVRNCSHAYFGTHYHDESNRRHEVAGYEPQTQTDLAIEFIRRRHDAPWGLVLSWGPPHDPYHDAPETHLAHYRGARLRQRRNVDELVRDRRDRTLTRDDALNDLRGYYAHITALDEQFGRLLAALDDSGQRDNTIVVYTSDHGDMLGSHGFTNKQLPYDEAVRVPLLARWPGRIPAQHSEAMVGLVDLPVSLLGLMGLRFPGAVDGADLHEVFCVPGSPGRDACYVFDYIPAHQAYHRGGEAWRAVRTPRFTLARKATGADWLLFDNKADPWQLHNLVDQPGSATLQRDLGERIDAFVAEHDRLLPGDEFIRHFDLREAWNRSQQHFDLPPLESERAGG
jgi:arylsulfatase A-like enzyme